MNRKKQILTTLLAVLSLFVSAVSACACSHHQPTKAEAETSCHGASHGSNEQPGQIKTTSNIIDSDCNCFEKTQVPAIVAKTDDKRTAVEKQIPDSGSSDSTHITLVVVQFNAASVSELTPHFYKRDLLSSLPSRAPPRL